MNGAASNAQTPRSHPEPPKASQELPQSLIEQPLSGGLAWDESPHSTKRRLDTSSETHPLPAAKRTRLEAQLEDKGLEQAAKTTLQQPEPRPPKRPHASFLEDRVDLGHPRPPPEPINNFISEWLESIGSDRENHCRSDSHLHYSHDPISRRLTRSAPEMAYTRDADGFMVPPMPYSYVGSAAASDLTGATPSSGRSSGRNLVEDPLYRNMNLAANNIYMQHPCNPIPEHIASLVDYICQNRNSPDLSLDEVRQDRDLYDLSIGAGEPDVEKYFHTRIFPNPESRDSLKRSDRQPMARHIVPSTGSKLKVSNPVPDLLYGYNRENAFPHQQAQLISMGTQMIANNQHNSLLYPFFIIEFKGDSGSMWVATNQCLGGSASCVSVVEHLNRELKQCKSSKIPVSSAAFSIAMNGTEARLYISWKHNELDYYMANIRSFLLQDPEHFIEFRKQVRNIIDWGKNKRLNEIRDSLNTILEEDRRRASEVAKSRPLPSGGSTTSRGRRHKSSSRSRSDSAQG